MINFIDNEFEVLPFILELLEDEKYSNPLINTEQEVIKCILLTMYSEIDFAIGIYNEDILTGVFGFVCDQNSNYLEMIFGYSKSLNAYNEMFNYLKENYKGYNVDFLINPKNDIFYNFLKTKNSKFYPLQLYMILETIVTYNSNHQIEFYSDKYKEEYINIHEKNMYWTGDKIILYPDRFKTLLAIYKNEVVGYIDYSYPYLTNEPYSIFVKENYRKKGFGKALLYNAIKDILPNNMCLRVDYDNLNAIKMYEQMGFIVDEKNSSILVNVQLD